MKVPKYLSSGSTVLLMGFPDCASSYFLLMELDKDFKPVFKLLESQSDSSAKGRSVNDLNNVLRIKKIDISQLQILEDELNLSILDRRKLVSFLPTLVEGPNQSSDHGLLSAISLDSSMQIAGGFPSSFSSVVDEVFGFEKGTSAPSYPSQNLSSSFATSPISHFGSVPMNVHGVKAGTHSPKWEGGLQATQINNVAKVPLGTSHYNGGLYSTNVKGPIHSSSLSALSSGLGRGRTVKKLSASKSDQDLASLRSPHSVEVGSMEEDVVSGTRSSRLLSPPRPTSIRSSAPGSKANGPRSSPTGSIAGSHKVVGSSSLVSTPICKIFSQVLARAYVHSLPYSFF